MKTLIQIQQEAVESILALPTQGKRAMGYGFTLLNKKGRSLNAIGKRYIFASMKAGFTNEQARTQWNDVKDMATLESQSL